MVAQPTRPTPPLPPDVVCNVRVHTIVPNDQITYIEYPINEFLDDDFSLPEASGGFRWIHVPVNNLAWVEACFEKCGSKLDPEIWTRKVRPALSRNAGVPLHARHMEPSCDGSHLHDLQLVMFLPYLNWDTFGNWKALRAVYERWRKDGGVDDRLPTPGSPRASLEYALFPYLDMKDPLHPRRTLDQFYYSSLLDTTSRDKDQTISKWTGTKSNFRFHQGCVLDNVDRSRSDPEENHGAENDPGADGRECAVDDSLLVMVDQVWCWVIDDKTVLSFFPSQESQYMAEGFRDLYHSIRSKAKKCADVCDFLALVAKKTTHHFFNQTNRTFTDIIEIYRWAVSRKAAHQMSCFAEFHRHYSNGSLGNIVLDDRRELKLVLEIADIIDELNIIQYLFKQQRNVIQLLIKLLQQHKPARAQPEGDQNVSLTGLTVRDHATVTLNIHQYPDTSFELENIKQLTNGIDGQAGHDIASADRRLLSLPAEIDIIASSAEDIHKRLLELLDLKSKTAALHEARSSTTQGRAVMLFTIVTIVFLPLSFFTSYFGQNVAEMTGDPRNPTAWELWRVATPITLFVVAGALVVAWFIGRPGSRVWSGRRRGARDVEGA